MKTVLTYLINIVCTGLLITSYHFLSTSLPVPVKVATENPVINEISRDLRKLNAPQERIPELSKAVYTAYQSSGINHKLITALMKTESNFKKNAVGPSNWSGIRYKGEMQTPTATRFSDVNILHGVRILEEKFSIAGNDLRTALALYKGGRSTVAYSQADEVIKVYRTL